MNFHKIYQKLLAHGRVFKRRNIYSSGTFSNAGNNVNLRNAVTKRMCTNSTSKPPTNKTLKVGLAGIAIGALVGTGYSISQLNNVHTHIINEENVIPILKDVPNHVPSRRVNFHPEDQNEPKFTLYQYQTCPFCCKVRAFLDYYGIPYDVIEVDPVLRQSIKWSPYKKVPQLLAKVDGGYQPLVDSSMIISAVATYLQDPDENLSNIVKFYPSISFRDEDGKAKDEIMNRYFLMFNEQRQLRKLEELNEERKWRKWADDTLVHTLSPNVYRTPAEAIQAFNWFSDVGDWDRQFPAWEKNMIVYVGSSAMWLIGKRLKKRHNLKDDVRQSLYDECNSWIRAIKKKGTPFMGGENPNLADLAVYGILSSIEGCDAFQDLLINSNIKNWYFSTKNAVLNHSGSDL